MPLEPGQVIGAAGAEVDDVEAVEVEVEEIKDVDEAVLVEPQV